MKAPPVMSKRKCKFICYFDNLYLPNRYLGSTYLYQQMRIRYLNEIYIQGERTCFGQDEE